MEQITGNIVQFVGYYSLDKVASRRCGEETRIVQVPFTGEKYSFLDSKSFGNYLLKEVGVLCDFYFAKVGSDGDVPML